MVLRQNRKSCVRHQCDQQKTYHKKSMRFVNIQLMTMRGGLQRFTERE